jgi:uncharacterized protein YjiS (DUF1127 family)
MIVGGETIDRLRLDARRQVWAAMSDLFLDTETRQFLPQIALVLADSGFTRSQLERIMAYEAIPEFGGTLLLPVGEWAVLDVDEASLTRRARCTPGRRSRWRWAAAASMVAPVWRGTLALYEVLWTMSAGARRAHATAWRVWARRYVDRAVGESPLLTDELDSLRDCGLSRLQALRSARQHFFPPYAALLTAHERMTRELRERHVVELIGRAFALSAGD